jgi:hypothetical protein
MATPAEHPWTSELVAAITSDTVVDLAARPDPGDRVVPSSSIREAILRITLQGRVPRLRVNAAIFLERLDLSHLCSPVTIELTNSDCRAGLDLSYSAIGRLNLSHSHLGHMQATSVQVAGDVELHHVQAQQINLEAAAISGDLDMFRARVDQGKTTPEMPSAICLDAARVTGTVSMPELVIVGELSALSCKVDGQFVLANSILTNPGLRAASLDGCTIGRIAIFDGMSSDGEVCLAGITVSGSLSAKKCNLSSSTGIALRLDSANTGGQVLLEPTAISGAISARSLKAESDVYIVGGEWRPSFVCIDLSRANVRGNLQFTSLCTRGDVRIQRIRVGGHAVISGCELHSLDGREALKGESVTCDGDFVIRETSARGPFVLSQSVVRGTADWQQFRLEVPEGNIVAQAGILTKGLLLDDEGLPIPVSPVKHGLHLTNCTFERLSLKDKTVSGPLFCAGWRIGAIAGDFWSDPKRVERWITHGEDEEGSFAPNSWHEVASAYERRGDLSAGRRLRFRAARRLTSRSPRRWQPLGWAYGCVVGHGYHPLLAVLWIFGLLGALTALGYARASDFVATVPGAGSRALVASSDCSTLPHGVACFSPVQYALEQAIPTLAGTQTGTWHITHSPWLSVCFVLCRGAIWVLDTFLIAGIAGLLRRT